MKTEHIPGPWHHDEYGHIYAGPYIIGETFEFEDIDGYGKEEALANTRLMAAAPEMYELMPKLIHLLGSWAYIIDQVGAYDTSESWDLADKWIDIRLKIEGNE